MNEHRIDRRGRIELRYYGDELDEVVARNCLLHIEQMGDEHWWLAVYENRSPDALRVDVNLWTPRTPIRAMAEWQ